MRLRPTNCASCQIYSDCIQICCKGIDACKQCLLDETILDQNYICPICNRQLSSAYRPLISSLYEEEQYSSYQNINLHNQGTYPQYYQNYSHTSAVQEQQFQFVKNSAYQIEENTQLKRTNSSNSMLVNRKTLSKKDQMMNQSNMPRNHYQNQMSNHGYQNGFNQRSEKPLHLERNYVNYPHQHQDQREKFNNSFNQNRFNQNNFRSNCQTQMVNHNIQKNNFQDRNHNSFTQNIRRPNGINVNSNIPVKTNNYQYQPQQFLQSSNSFGPVDQARVNKNIFNPQINKNNWIQNQNSSVWNQQQNQAAIPQQYLNNLNQQQNTPRLLNQRSTKSAVKLRDNSTSPHRNGSFKIIQEHKQRSQKVLQQQKSPSDEKDYSPTFGFQSNDLTTQPQMQNQPVFRQEEQTKQIIKLRRSNSSYTLG